MSEASQVGVQVVNNEGAPSNGGTRQSVVPTKDKAMTQPRRGGVFKQILIEISNAFTSNSPPAPQPPSPPSPF